MDAGTDAAPSPSRVPEASAADVSAPPSTEASVPDAAPGTPEAAPREAGPDAPPEAAPPEAGPFPVAEYPRLLSETGLFTDIHRETLGKGVRPFAPRYVLWSDGATKRRWLYLPDGKQIDTSDMDYWTYPAGTTAWKEFTRDGVRVETRMLRKRSDQAGDWMMIAYQWRRDQSDAVAVPAGVPNASGTPHDIPSQQNCQYCHGSMKDALLGVTAIQLSHAADGVGFRIDDLIAEGRLTAPPQQALRIPGGPVTEAAFGYLHANCGLCHNGQSLVGKAVPLRLWEMVDRLDTVEHTTAYSTTVDRPNSFDSTLHVIEPGLPDRSELIERISARGSIQMPPLATKVVDTAGVAKIREWVESLPRPHDGGLGDAEAGTP